MKSGVSPLKSGEKTWGAEKALAIECQMFTHRRRMLFSLSFQSLSKPLLPPKDERHDLFSEASMKLLQWEIMT
jgi:hypothetical protein